MSTASTAPRFIKYGPITNNAELAAEYFKTETSVICSTKYGSFLCTKDDIVISANTLTPEDDQQFSEIVVTKDEIIGDILTVPANMAEELKLTMGAGIEGFEIYIEEAISKDSPTLEQMRNGDFSAYKQKLAPEQP